MKGVEIIDLELVKDDERGSIFQFDNRDSPKLLLVKRKKGTISGAHYHKGKSPLKDPQVMVLLDGEADIILKNVKTKEEFRQTFKKPTMFRVDAYIYHEVLALTDITILDMNTFDDEEDTVKGCELE